MKSSLQKLLTFLALTGLAHGADLISSGDWIESVTAAHLVSGAGSDFQPQFQSISGASTLTISNAPGSWSLRVRRSGGRWPAGVAIHVKRTSGGSGSGSVSGGTAYVELTNFDAEIFSGSEARSGISLQFKLTGLSSRLTPGTYPAAVIFTVVP